VRKFSVLRRLNGAWSSWDASRGNTSKELTVLYTEGKL
jgi:hypothetical protein